MARLAPLPLNSPVHNAPYAEGHSPSAFFLEFKPMTVIANRPLRGEYGLVNRGQQFEVRDEVAEQLLKKGLVTPVGAPRVEYETKVLRPAAPEVSARQPFRELPVFDPQPEGMASEGDRVFSTADVPAPRADNPRGRRGRKTHHPGR
jgi:hypothetical protein